MYKEVKGKVKIVEDFPIKLKIEIIQWFFITWGVKWIAFIYFSLKNSIANLTYSKYCLQVFYLFWLRLKTYFININQLWLSNLMAFSYLLCPPRIISLWFMWESTLCWNKNFKKCKNWIKTPNINFNFHKEKNTSKLMSIHLNSRMLHMKIS